MPQRSPHQTCLMLMSLITSLACNPHMPGESTSTTDGGDMCVSTSPTDVDMKACEAHPDAASCKPPCRWFESQLFDECGGDCSLASPSGVCVTFETAPETGCSEPCTKFWRATAGGLQIFETKTELCFELPAMWNMCNLDEVPECACGCESPP